MDTHDAASRWRDTWSSAWPARDPEPIIALYGDDAEYRALQLREPERGRAGVRRYLEENFGVEEAVDCTFKEPIVAGDRATVEWWASWVEDGQPLTLAGVTLLRFDADGMVVDHRDYWNQVERREPPYAGW